MGNQLIPMKEDREEQIEELKNSNPEVDEHVLRGLLKVLEKFNEFLKKGTPEADELIKEIKMKYSLKTKKEDEDSLTKKEEDEDSLKTKKEDEDSLKTKKEDEDSLEEKKEDEDKE